MVAEVLNRRIINQQIFSIPIKLVSYTFFTHQFHRKNQAIVITRLFFVVMLLCSPLSLYPIHFSLICFEEKVELFIVITRLSLSCKNSNVGHYLKSIKGINTTIGILAHYDQLQL